MPALSARHRTHVVDLPGFGRSPIPAHGDLSPPAEAHALADFLRALESPRFVLVGHSMGAGIALLAALDLAAEVRARIAGLVLVSAAVYPQRLPPYMRLLRTPGIGELFLVAPPPAWALARGIRRIVEDPGTVDAEQVAGYRAPLMDRRRRRAILRAARQVDLRAGDRLAGRLRDLPAPALVVWGDRDRVVPPSAGERLVSDLPNATFVRLPGIGHLPPEEDERSVDPVLEFLASLGTTPEPRQGVEIR